MFDIRTDQGAVLMKKTLLASVAMALALPLCAQAADVKIGVILGFTGPIESLTPGMADSAELAFAEASDSGMFLNGTNIIAVRADSTCVDSAAATAAAERLVTSDGVVAIMGADCSGVTGAVLENVAMPNGVVMISPSATSPSFTTREDNGLFFRTAPSDARQGEVLAQVLMDRGVKEVAVTYTNNDYGKGFADAFDASYAAMGGKVLMTAAHEDGKADYSAEVGALSASGANLLVVLGYADQGGRGIIQASVDTGAFDNFALGDGMFSDSLIEAIGDDLAGTIGTVPASAGDGAQMFLDYAEKAGFSGDGAYRGTSYDAAALLVLAIQAAGSADRAMIAGKVMDVANAPGEKIYPGELAKALKILANGGEVDYVGATDIELVGGGEAGGAYREFVVKDGAYETVKMR
ncbi:MAG: branched-chain amino acid transport system substrate-binding protein [Paracoccaceae bacterium]|jgi:branched-chain amino acid transport system substrate-binding protein